VEGGERGLEWCTCQGRFAKEVARGGRVLENREMGERGRRLGRGEGESDLGKGREGAGIGR